MTRGIQDHSTRDAIITFLKADSEPRPLLLICRYMRQMHRVQYGATRECLRRLCNAGIVTNTSRGYYQWNRA